MLLMVGVFVLVTALGTTAFLFAADRPPGGSDTSLMAPAVGNRTSLAPRPSDAPGTHTVAPLESLFTIGFGFDVTLDELRYWNRDAYPSVDSSPQLEVGWVLIVDGPPLPTASPAPTQALPTLGPEPAPGFVGLPVLTVEIWNSDVRYFPISGQTPDELLASIRANIPPPPGALADPMAYVGPVVWEHVPRYGKDSTGACIVTGIRSRVRYEATIPQWSSPSTVPAPLLEWWSVVLEHFRWHEEQHVRIFTDFVGQLPGRISGQPCDAVEAIADQWTAELTAAHDAFDTQDLAWQPPPYGGP